MGSAAPGWRRSGRSTARRDKNNSMDTGIPRSIANRVEWRPAGLSSASLAESLGRRRSVFLDRAQRVSAWYERFFRRVQPFYGWTQMAFDFTGTGEYVTRDRDNFATTGSRPIPANFERRKQQRREARGLPVRSPIRLAILGSQRCRSGCALGAR